ncbi:MAG: hypothetical protein K2P46_00445, partial [Alistipes sp.]|nr:hypothetical protein [Alistipes sp.]
GLHTGGRRIMQPEYAIKRLKNDIFCCPQGICYYFCEDEWGPKTKKTQAPHEAMPVLEVVPTGIEPIS